MLQAVLAALQSAESPLHVAELSRQLNIERSALDGMIAYWVRKGRLVVGDSAETVCSPTAGGCGASCGVASCPFTAKMPKTVTVQLKQIDLPTP
jgi:hypothetical protein